LNLQYENIELASKLWKIAFKQATQAGRGKSRIDLDDLDVFGKSIDSQIQFLDTLDIISAEPYFNVLVDIYGNNPTSDQIYEFILIQKSERSDIQSIVGTDKKGRPCSNRCKMYGNKCYCRLFENDEFSECKSSECGVTGMSSLLSKIW